VKKIALIICLIAFLAGCNGNQQTQNQETQNQAAYIPLTSILERFKEANTIEFYSIINESFRHAESFEILENNEGGSFSRTSTGNITFSRTPFSSNSINISNTNVRLEFTKMSYEYMGESLLMAIYMVEVSESDFTITNTGEIILTREFREAAIEDFEYRKAAPRTLDPPEMGEPLFHSSLFSEEPQVKIIMQMNDHMRKIIFLIERNSHLFESYSTTNEIFYRGYIAPDTIIDYFTGIGNDVFNYALFPYFEGEMTREALVQPMIDNWSFAISQPLYMLLFTDEPMPVTISKNLRENTFSISIDMTVVQNAFYRAMYTVWHSGARVSDEHVIEYRNIRLN